MIRALTLCLISLLAASRRLEAQANEEERTIAALAGLGGVNVVAEDPGQDADRLGITRDALRTQVELQLRQYGIRVHTESQFLASPTGASIDVNVTVLKKDELFAFNATIEFYEVVSLLRPPSTKVTRTIWQASTLGVAGSGRLSSSIRETVQDHVNKFINLYLAANPRKTP
jgi:hypothetical protein